MDCVGSSNWRAIAPSERKALVWSWLPDATEPVLAGRMDVADGICRFSYDDTYLARPGATSLHPPELPLGSGVQPPAPPHVIAGCLRDAAPDHWGRRVICAHLTGRMDPDMDTGLIRDLDYLLLSGSDRTGALDFRATGDAHESRSSGDATLDALLEAVEAFEAGRALPPDLPRMLVEATAIGGARPKVLVTEGGRKLIAKLSSGRDRHAIVRAELIGLRLAEAAGITVARAELRQVGQRDVLLVERFDRFRRPDGWARRHMLSALTLLGLDETMSYYASYEDLAAILAREGADPATAVLELYRRMTFNILIGNTDDHARNHAAFRERRGLALTPAYDLEPRPRMGREANQAMRIHGGSRQGRIALALDAAPGFGLSSAEAAEIVAGQIEAIHEGFDLAVEEAGIGDADRRILANGAILNPYVFEGAPAEIARLECPLGQ